MATLAQLAQAYLNQGLPSISGIFQPSSPTIGPITKLPVEPEPGITPQLLQPMNSGGGGCGFNNPYDLSRNFSQITSDRQKRLSQDPTGLNKFLIDNLGMKQPQTAEDIVNLGYRTPSKFGIGALLPDKYGELPRADQAFIASRMGYTGPTVFGENNSGLSKDPFGLNTRSAFGNYAERVGVEAENLGKSLEKSAAKKGLSFDPATGKVTGGTPAEIAAWEKQTSMLNTKFDFYTKEDAAYKDYQNQVQNVLDADKEFSIEGDSSNYGIDGYPKYDIKDIMGEEEEDNEIDPTDPLKIDPISKKNAITNQIFQKTINDIKQREIEKQRNERQQEADRIRDTYRTQQQQIRDSGGYAEDGGGGPRRGDSDISNSARDNKEYATDDTAGFFAKGGRVKFLNGGLADLVYLLGLK